METRSEKLEKVGSIAAHGLLIGKFLLASLGGAARTTAQEAILKVPLFDSHLLSSRLAAEDQAQTLVKKENDFMVYGAKDYAEYQQQLKAQALQRKEDEAHIAEDLDGYEPLEEAVIDLEIGKFAVASATKG